MARDDLHFRLRIPEELKSQVEASANEHRRSMTAEIIARLEASFAGATQQQIDGSVRQYLGALTSENEALRLSCSSLEAILFNVAHALRKAAQGENAALDLLIEGERDRALLTKIVQVTPDAEDRL